MIPSAYLLLEAPPNVVCLQRAPRNEERPRDATDTRRTPAHSRNILCASCLHQVTTRDQRTERGGSFMHHVTNPLGVHFHIGCFVGAPGCRLDGQATPEWSWFPGYSWSLALCGSCGIQLGWHYSGADTFYGLILSRLVNAPT